MLQGCLQFYHGLQGYEDASMHSVFL